jgi:indole-3-glycerol phosphate synthase
LQRDGLGLIAEIKRRSPSAGLIAAELDPQAHARLYATAGASAISVLTNHAYFGGSLDDLSAVAAVVSTPLLRKDFIVDDIQILEARRAGASAVLLIVRALPPDDLAHLIQFARAHALEPLVEVHSADEIALALHSGADILGVNSRDLDTLETDPARSWDLLPLIPGRCLAIAESSMSTLADVEAAASAGADAVLIGRALSACSDPTGLIRGIRQVPRRGR